MFFASWSYAELAADQDLEDTGTSPAKKQPKQAKQQQPDTTLFVKPSKGAALAQQVQQSRQQQEEEESKRLREEHAQQVAEDRAHDQLKTDRVMKQLMLQHETLIATQQKQWEAELQEKREQRQHEKEKMQLQIKQQELQLHLAKVSTQGFQPQPLQMQGSPFGFASSGFMGGGALRGQVRETR